MADLTKNFKDKLQAYLKVEDLSQLVLLRRKTAPGSEESLKDKELESSVNLTQLYEIKKILGAGGFGVVCEVVCRKTQRPCALKITLWND